MKKLKTEGMRFVHEDGSEVILSGVNMVCKSKEQGYVEPCDENLFRWFHEQGFNVIRMGLIWDGVEPEPGVYDDVYLEKIKQQIHWAERHGIYVFLDMHQDLYSQLYSDGAPEWATFTDGLPHVPGDLWSDAYFGSPAVNRAFDHFWNNRPAEDGIGLQDHYTEMWKHVVRFFEDCPNVIGYDLMNEPYPGTHGQLVLGAMIQAYGEYVLGIQEPNMEELSALWLDGEKKQQILRDLRDLEIYKKLVAVAEEPSQDFEREILSPFFNRLAEEIRKINSERFIMLETSYFANMGIESGVQLVRNHKDEVKAGQVYAPHGYDLVVDTEHYDIYNKDRVDFIFDRHRKVQKRLGVPTLIGEWGAFTNHPATVPLTRQLIKIFEGYLWSNTYWSYTDGFQDMPYLQVLNRAYPQVTGGKLTEYHYNDSLEKVSVKYVPAGLETMIYHPKAASLTDDDIMVVGVEDYQAEIQPYAGVKGGVIRIFVPERDHEVTVTIG